MAWVPLMFPGLRGAVTVTVSVAIALAQPPEPVTVYVMVEVPAATGVITPVDGSTVALAISDDVHAPPEAPSDVNVVVVPSEHIACVPLTVPAFGVAVTVTVCLAVAFAQPPEPVTV